MLPSEHLDAGAATALPTRQLPSLRKAVLKAQALPVRECHSKHFDIDNFDLLL
jgi:hypothetical protein